MELYVCGCIHVASFQSSTSSRRTRKIQTLQYLHIFRRYPVARLFVFLYIVSPTIIILITILSSSLHCTVIILALWSFCIIIKLSNVAILHYNHIMKIVVVLHYNHFIRILAIIMIKTFRWFCNSGFFLCFSHRHQKIPTPPLIKDNHWNLTKDNH